MIFIMYAWFNLHNFENIGTYQIECDAGFDVGSIDNVTHHPKQGE